MGDLFELLDVDGSGRLTRGEFVEGLLNLVLMDAARSADVIIILYYTMLHHVTPCLILLDYIVLSYIIGVSSRFRVGIF